MTNENTSDQWHHGEPWRLIMGGKIRDCREDVIHHVKDRARAVACVNALAGRDPSKLAALETALEDYIIAHEKWEADVILYDESGDPRTEPPRLTKELYEGAIVVQTKRREAQAALAAFRGEGRMMTDTDTDSENPSADQYFRNWQAIRQAAIALIDAAASAPKSDCEHCGDGRASVVWRTDLEQLRKAVGEEATDTE